jgi:hypothetical protein
LKIKFKKRQLFLKNIFQGSFTCLIDVSLWLFLDQLLGVFCLEFEGQDGMIFEEDL